MSMNFGNMGDLSKMIKQMTKAQEDIKCKMEKINDEKENITYAGTVGDDSLWVSVVIDGNYKMLSMEISNHLQCSIEEDATSNFCLLIDLIIAAHSKAHEKASENEGAGDLDDFLPEDMKSLLGNMGNFLK